MIVQYYFPVIVTWTTLLKKVQKLKSDNFDWLYGIYCIFNTIIGSLFNWLYHDTAFVIVVSMEKAEQLDMREGQKSVLPSR